MSISFIGSRPNRFTVLHCNAAGCQAERVGANPAVYINTLRDEARKDGWAVAVHSRHSLVNDYCSVHAEEMNDHG